MATKTVSKSNAPQTTSLMPASDVISQARSNGDTQSLVNAAVLLAGYPPNQLDGDAKAFLKEHSATIWSADSAAADKASEAERRVTEAKNALATATDHRAMMDAMLCAFAYGVTEVAKVYAKGTLAKQWGLKTPSALTPYITAGRARAQAQLSDATTAKVRQVAATNVEPSTLGAAKGAKISSKALTAISRAKDVTDEASFRKAIAEAAEVPEQTEQTNTRGESTPDGVLTEAELNKINKLIFELTGKVVQVNEQKVVLPDGRADADKLSGRDNVRHLHSVLSAYLKRTEPAKGKAATK